MAEQRERRQHERERERVQEWKPEWVQTPELVLHVLRWVQSDELDELCGQCRQKTKVRERFDELKQEVWQLKQEVQQQKRQSADKDRRMEEIESRYEQEVQALQQRLVAVEKAKKQSEAALEEKLKEKDRMIAIIEQVAAGGKVQAHAGGLPMGTRSVGIDIPSFVFDVRSLTKISSCVGVQWRAFGRLLGYTNSELEDYNRFETNSEKTYQLISAWRDKLGRRATTQLLLQACDDIGVKGAVEDKLGLQ